MAITPQEHELWETLKVTRIGYTELAARHEQLLGWVQRGPPAGSGRRTALQLATELGPQLSMALRQYLDAVEILKAFYERPASSTEGDGQQDGDSIL